MALVLGGDARGAYAGEQQATELNVRIPVQLKYLLYLPEGYDQKESWPLMLFLHGAGERGDDLELVKVHGPPKLIAAGKHFPFIVVSPQCPKGKWWDPFVLSALLDDVVQHHKVDQDRIYVTGLSMGGFGTWALAAYNRERFAAIAPICGGGDTIRAKYITHIPTWTFHGALDKSVPLSRSEEMVAAIEKAGGKPKLTVYPEAAHDSWTQTYENEELYAWLLQHQRPDEPPPDPDQRPRRSR
jgi:predicted peptidase